MHSGSVARNYSWLNVDSGVSILFTEFTEATRITGGLSKHRQKPYNAYYPYN